MKTTLVILTALGLGCSAFAGEAQAFAVQSTKETQIGERTITFVKVAPPVLERVASPATPPAQPPSADELRRETKKQDRIEIIATVYMTTPVFSKLEVRRDGQEYAYVSNIDFRDLTQVGSFEGANTVYDWFPWVYDGGSEEAAYPVGLRSDIPAFLPVGQSNEFAQEVLTLIHNYYAANKARLIEDRTKREAEAAVQAEKDKINPPEKKPVTLRYWELPAQK